MKITKLNLANEIYRTLEHLKKELARYENALNIAKEQLNEGVENIFLNELPEREIGLFPLKEFSEFMESKIKNYKIDIKELEIKFKQL